MRQVLIRDTVDIYKIDDASTGDRMGRNQTANLVNSAVWCRVNEQSPKPASGGPSEVVAHSHRVQFWQYMDLAVNHQIWWTNPEGGGVVKMRVLGTKKAASTAMPYVAYCQAFESGA